MYVKWSESHWCAVVTSGHNGTINGQGQTWWKKYRQKLLNHTRGPLLQIMWSSDILISNITLRDSPFWTFHPFDCKNVTVRNVTILAPVFEAPNTDGIDPGNVRTLFSFSVPPNTIALELWTMKITWYNVNISAMPCYCNLIWIFPQVFWNLETGHKSIIELDEKHLILEGLSHYMVLSYF